ncbi:MAG: ATP-binding cassette domain-containing protein, partial [Arenicellales bacterium]|nr:ATP-binding cassette domain-containing protein [Arenicellales bacterium]
FHEPEVLLLDEPTSLLTPQEADQLFVVLRGMADEGKGIVFITHKMREVFAVSDRVTVLKLGKMQGTCYISETTEDELTRRTFGETVPDYMERPAVEFSENAIEVDRLIPKGLEKKAPASGLSFALRKGEILGLAGVAGNGQSELIASITGLSGVSSGTVTILGEEMTNRTPRAFIEKGVAHIPERRREMGIIEQMFVAENVALKDYRKTPFSRHTVLNRGEITRHAEEIVSRFNALVPDLWETECRILSGGNIQRLILGRETWREPSVIIASHPTEGLDAKAIRHTWELFLALRAQGSAILLISEDLDEVMSLSDRIGVIFEGGIVGVVEGENANREQLGHWMAGGRISAAA